MQCRRTPESYSFLSHHIFLLFLIFRLTYVHKYWHVLLVSKCKGIGTQEVVIGGCSEVVLHYLCACPCAVSWQKQGRHHFLFLFPKSFQFSLCQENMEKGQDLYANSYSTWGSSVNKFGMWSITENLQPLCCNGVSVMEPQTNNRLDPTGSKIDTSLLPKIMWIFIKQWVLLIKKYNSFLLQEKISIQ